MEIILDGIEDLPKAAQQLIDFAGGRKKWTFKGEIGAGKTTFIQTLCKKLGVEDKVTSPTFSLVNEYIYLDAEKRQKQVHHIDLYRLNSLDEAINIGIEDYLFDDSYCFLEWPQIIEPLLPENAVEINIEIIDNSTRKMIFL